MNGNSNRPKHSFWHWPLSIGILMAVVLSLVAGAPAQAANPNSAPYIIVFKDTVNPTAAAPGWRKRTVCRPALSTSTL